MNLALQLLLNGIAMGALYSIVALGFGLIYNTTHIFHIAHGVIYTVAGYILFSSLVQLHLPLPLAVAMSLTCASAFGVLMELLVYRPLYKKNASLTIPFISSLGVYIFFQNLIALLYGNQTKVLITEPEKTYSLGSLIISRIQLIEVFSALLIFILFYSLTNLTRFGKSLKAISNNPLLAEVVGIDIKKFRLGIFAVGSILAGAGAILSALDVGIDPNVGFPVVLVAIVSVIIGGAGVFEGAFLGGLLIGVVMLPIFQDKFLAFQR
jgi:branched-chain amino acid transport system permease protein